MVGWGTLQTLTWLQAVHVKPEVIDLLQGIAGRELVKLQHHELTTDPLKLTKYQADAFVRQRDEALGTAAWPSQPTKCVAPNNDAGPGGDGDDVDGGDIAAMGNDDRKDDQWEPPAALVQQFARAVESTTRIYNAVHRARERASVVNGAIKCGCCEKVQKIQPLTKKDRKTSVISQVWCFMKHMRNQNHKAGYGSANPVDPAYEITSAINLGLTEQRNAIKRVLSLDEFEFTKQNSDIVGLGEGDIPIKFALRCKIEGCTDTIKGKGVAQLCKNMRTHLNSCEPRSNTRPSDRNNSRPRKGRGAARAQADEETDQGDGDNEVDDEKFTSPRSKQTRTTGIQSFFSPSPKPRLASSPSPSSKPTTSTSSSSPSSTPTSSSLSSSTSTPRGRVTPGPGGPPTGPVDVTSDSEDSEEIDLTATTPTQPVAKSTTCRPSEGTSPTDGSGTP